MDFVNPPLLAAAALVFVSVLAGLFSARIGFSFLLVFLLAGILAGEDGPGGYLFDDIRLSFWVGNLALAVILLDGGLRTAFATFRTGLKPASVLATVGVLMCAALTGLAGMLFLDLDWGTAMLLGAIVGSTDAAAVFALLTRSGVTLNERVAATLEIESGVNDPMAVYLTLAFIALLAPGAADSGASAGVDMAWAFVQQFGWGTLAGVGGGLAMSALLRRVAARDAGGGILALLIGAAGLSVFAATGLLGGSGFLAVYLFGLIVANRAAEAVAPTLAAMDGYAWLAQAGMFLLLGLLVTPSDLLSSLLPALGVALALIFVARPVTVWLCLWPFRFTPRETWYIAWVGLRGAVPIVLALFPLLAGTPQADLLFNVAFVVVLVSLLTQGTTIAVVARRLGVAMPEPGDEREQRAVFRDFELDPKLPVTLVCEFYNLPAPAGAAQALGDWMAAELRRPPVAGDSVTLGSATLVVRELDQGRISRIGLGLPD
jgi:cell volume regulation protein A